MSDWLDIHAYADGQLDGDEKRSVEERLKTCEKSQAELRAVQGLKAVVQEKCPSMHCQETWERSRKRLDEIDRTKRAEFFVGKYAWGICAIFFVVIFSAAMFNRTMGGGLRTGDVLASSLSSVGSPRSQAPSEQQKWLQGFLPEQRLSMPENNIRVLGGAVGQMDGKKIVRLNLEDGKGELALFIVSQVNHVDDMQQLQGHSMYSAGRVNNRNCLTWNDGGWAYLMIGERSIDELVHAADAMYSR